VILRLVSFTGISGNRRVARDWPIDLAHNIVRPFSALLRRPAEIRLKTSLPIETATGDCSREQSGRVKDEVA
jgi:hypothetical protein